MDEEEESQDQRDAFCSIGLEVCSRRVSRTGELAKLVLILFLTSPRKFQF